METSIVGLKARLSAEYKYRTELHAHTFPVSGCSQVSPERMADIYAKRGYDGLALTNHFLWGKDKNVREYVDFFFCKGFGSFHCCLNRVGIVAIFAQIRHYRTGKHCHDKYYRYNIS